MNFFRTVQQVWDKNANQWIVTLLEAPTQQMVTTMLGDIGIQPSATTGAGKQSAAGKLPQQGGQKQQPGNGTQTQNQPKGGTKQ